ncbi:MAG TPA: hypothetical protein VGM84_04995 [Steroidobacteraceae bacterium]
MRTANVLKWLLMTVPVLPLTVTLAQAPGRVSAVAGECDRNCLIGSLHNYLDALVHKDPKRAKLAPDVRFTENDVEMPIGEGIWHTISAVSPTGLEVADPTSGNASWFGLVEEYGESAYYTMRIKVHDGLITEVETVVDRKGSLPAPFGDPAKVVHDPEFNAVLPPEERRPRERLIAVANGYFSTVELNDGQIFTAFDPDCGRLENGISTTAPTRAPTERGAANNPSLIAQGGNASSLAQGCEAQFKLGIYRINKRVRERRYEVVDEERGIVVATGFFDHANSFDHYKLNDGREMKTALKWPNSITLMEAFKIRNGKIYRIEAVFTYVPYFMHNPWAYPPARGQVDATARAGGKAPAVHGTGTASASAHGVSASACGRDCLIASATQYLDALVAQDPSKVKWAKVVHYSENSVSMMIGDGIWATATARSPNGQFTTDPSTGNVVWYGSVEEHGQPAHVALRLKVEGGGISEAETVIRRKGVDEGPFGDAAHYSSEPSFTQEVPKAQRGSRAELIKLADGYFSTLQQNDGTIRTKFDPQCARKENGQTTTDGSFGSAPPGCEAQFKLGYFKYDDRVRARRFIVDEEHGVVVATGYIDHSASFMDFKTTDGKPAKSPFKSPNSLGFMEKFKIVGGRIYRIEAVFTTLPYYMSSPWGD